MEATVSETTSLLSTDHATIEPTKSTDEDSDNAMSSRSCFGQSHVRADWDETTPRKPGAIHSGALRGMVTTQEGLWGVIIGMDVSALRKKTIDEGFDFCGHTSLGSSYSGVSLARLSTTRRVSIT
jgi:hypothetical protein